MSKRVSGITFAFAGLLALTPAFAQHQGSTSGGTTTQQGTGSGTMGTGASSDSDDTRHGGSSGMTGGAAGHTMDQETAHGSEHGAMAGGSGGALTNQDEKFLREAADGGMMEVELGRLAAERAASADVKAFGQRMVTDHGKANQQLMQVAANKGLTLSKDLSADKKNERDRFAKLSGAEFDRMYMQHMVKDHRKDVSEFEKESQKGGDAGVRSFAQQTLPILRDHLTLAESVAGKVGVKTTPDHSGHSHR
jgi:putative membrane protein